MRREQLRSGAAAGPAAWVLISLEPRCHCHHAAAALQHGAVRAALLTQACCGLSQVVKALLTYVTAEHFQAHGDCLMQAVRCTADAP